MDSSLSRAAVPNRTRGRSTAWARSTSSRPLLCCIYGRLDLLWSCTATPGALCTIARHQCRAIRPPHVLHVGPYPQGSRCRSVMASSSGRHCLGNNHLFPDHRNLFMDPQPLLGQEPYSTSVRSQAAKDGKTPHRLPSCIPAPLGPTPWAFNTPVAIERTQPPCRGLTIF